MNTGAVDASSGPLAVRSTALNNDLHSEIEANHTSCQIINTTHRFGKTFSRVARFGPLAHAAAFCDIAVVSEFPAVDICR